MVGPHCQNTGSRESWWIGAGRGRHRVQVGTSIPSRPQQLQGPARIHRAHTKSRPEKDLPAFSVRVPFGAKSRGGEIKKK